MADKLVQAFGEAYIRKTKAQEKVLEKENERSLRLEMIDAERQEKREILAQALREYDEVTNKLKRTSDDEAYYEIEITKLQNELAEAETQVSESLEALEALKDPFVVECQDANMRVIKTVEKRSGGYTLKTVTEALVKSGKFSSKKEAEEVLKVHNKVDQIVLKIVRLDDDTPISVEKIAGRSSKRSRTQ